MPRISSRTVKERVTSVRQQKDISRDDAYRALLKGFTKDRETDTGPLGDDELRRAEEFVRERYRTDGWNRMR